MFLRTVPLLFAVAGLVLYTVLAGADFGAGLWLLTAGGGEHGRAIRDHAHRANAPVWEANHVWLIFTLTVGWTAYPVVVGSIASTLTIPLSIAAVGIILRGLTYTLQSATEVPRERRFIDTTFCISSIVTPFMLGAVVGGIASGRVPVGNAAGNLVTSWVNPTSILCGVLAVAVGAYLAAVYLAADARRVHAAGLDNAFRTRALIAGVATGAVSIAGLFVVDSDAHPLFHGLTTGWGLVCVIISALAGAVSVVLVWLRHFGVARGVAAVAVAALLAGWVTAQRPFVLPGLTLQAAAADNATLIAIIVAVVVGGLILAPCLGLLFRLVLSGRFYGTPARVSRHRVYGPDAPRPAWAGRLALALFVAGFLLLTIADARVAHVFGIIAFAGTAIAAYTAVGPDILAARDMSVHEDPRPPAVGAGQGRGPGR